jgi:TolA-binding protein
MTALRTTLAIGLILIAGLTSPNFAADNAPATTSPAGAADNQQVLDAFVAAEKSDKAFSADRIAKAEELVAALRAEPDGHSIAITEALRELYPDYREALAALGEENLGAAVASLEKLRTANDPYLAADASYFLARAYMLDERFEEALPLLTAVTTKWTGKTLRDGEALFMLGVAQIQLLKHDEATATLAQFLGQFPAAPERMRVGAFRQLEQLKAFQAGTLSDVQLRMDYSRRRLLLEDSGQATRAQQDKIIDLLAALIKEAEERECNGKGNGKGSGQAKKQGKGSEGDSQAQGEGQGKQGGNSGGGSKGTDEESVKRLHRGGPQSPWSRLRDKDRDPVFNAIKEKFPGRYQQLIEQYYKSFQDETES